MTDRECFLYTRAFLEYLRRKSDARKVLLAGDLRASTPRIAGAAAFAVRRAGLALDFCGTIPTPALTCLGIEQNAAGIMVTGSHIPDDRNGIKFNMPWGEVLKADEREIVSLYEAIRDDEESLRGESGPFFTGQGALRPEYGRPGMKENPLAERLYTERFLRFFPPRCLKGLRIVFYQHSTVSREIFPRILGGLGAEVVKVGWSEAFVPVDTEAVEDAERLAGWVRENGAHALVSADGDGDRPLVTDEEGREVRGDVLGILAAEFLGADSVSAPVSCNTALELCGRFGRTLRTKIGSPYVIESMQNAVREGCGKAVGYEANGGFLTATDIRRPGCAGPLRALPTRDAVLPVLALLFLSVERTCSVSALVSGLPPRFTYSGIVRDFPSARGAEIVERFRREGATLAARAFQDLFGQPASLDFTDGARVTFGNGDVVHLRPSGNAPELRCYTESSSAARAEEMNRRALEQVRKGALFSPSPQS
jgi:phosphomannomutase